jgi:hypothetical protein
MESGLKQPPTLTANTAASHDDLIHEHRRQEQRMLSWEKSALEPARNREVQGFATRSAFASGEHSPVRQYGFLSRLPRYIPSRHWPVHQQQCWIDNI